MEGVIFMEENLHSINAMRSMEVIDINTGSRVGFIKDIKIDSDEHKILSILLPGEAKGWFSTVAIRRIFLINTSKNI